MIDLRVYLETLDRGILGSDQTALEETIQAAQLLVRADGKSEKHVVVSAAEPPFRLASGHGAVARLFPSAHVSIVVSDTPGLVSIICPDMSAEERFRAAVAVSVVKRSWGWDESPLITVAFESGAPAVSVNPVFRDGAWILKGA